MRSSQRLDIPFRNPIHIKSNLGTQFTSTPWRQLSTLLGFEIHTTTAYHLQANGLVERFHSSLKNTVRLVKLGLSNYRGFYCVYKWSKRQSRFFRRRNGLQRHLGSTRWFCRLPKKHLGTTKFLRNLRDSVTALLPILTSRHGNKIVLVPTLSVRPNTFLHATIHIWNRQNVPRTVHSG